MSSLPDIQRNRIEKHFEQLAHARARSDLPIFAMEHGLCQKDLRQIQTILNSQCKIHSLQSSDWLLWVIYATEVGYTYTGEEYWQSFEQQTPGWESQNRNKIRNYFTKFQSLYNGVQPSGPWASHFTIIAWPITHAILPRYLQHQFAKALFDLRYRLAGMTTLNPSEIGQLLAENAHIPTTRFREFLQQKELIGRIILALLDEKSLQDHQLIHPPTLQRIVDDLNEVRASREWLKETRKVVSDRFKGIGQGLGMPRAHPPALGLNDRSLDPALFIRPKLVLRPGRGCWSVQMEVPSFQSIAVLNPDIRSFLKHTRCRLNGGNSMKPGGWLLSGNRKGNIQSWPDATKPLIQLENPHPIIDHLLESGCLLSNKGPWLFRIGLDNIAREVIGHFVRSGCNYIVVSTMDLPQVHEAISMCNLDCKGVNSFYLKIPPYVSSDMTSWLDEIGLEVVRTIHVWPAGLPGRGWDGEGRSEWLTTETPCFGISHDHPVDAYAFRLNGGSKKLIQTDGTENTLFVRMSPLPAGKHHLNVEACRNPAMDAVASSPPARGFVQLIVREPEPWIPGATSHSGLIVSIDPNEPDLDTFWKNKVRLSVNGPEAHAVTLSIELKTKSGQKVFSGSIGGPINLPINPEKWDHSFKKFLQSFEEKNLSPGYIESSTGILTINGDALGRCSLVFEREPQPLRWMTKKAHGGIIIQLLDDTGLEEFETKIYHYKMNQPINRIEFPLEAALSGFKAESPGGLFVAERDKYIDAVAVSKAPDEIQNIDLRFNPIEFPREQQKLTEIMHTFDQWLNARCSGFLIRTRYFNVISFISNSLCAMLCGENWAKAEANIQENSMPQQIFEGMKSHVDKNLNFAKALFDDFSSAEEHTAQPISWFTETATRHKISNNRELCEFALHLTSSPHVLESLSFAELHALSLEIFNNPAILRGARLLALLTESGRRS